MKKLTLKKVFLTLLIVSILSIGLTGCLDFITPTPTPTTGTVYIHVTGDYTYDLYMDSVTKFWDKEAGTYTIAEVSIGNHKFEAIDAVWGADYGYISKTEYISAGTNDVYLDVPWTPPF